MSKGPPFNTIFFDCDSTLTTLEGIDDLAEEIGVSHKIQELTQFAMDGHVSLEDVYQQRLEMIRLRPDGSRAPAEWTDGHLRCRSRGRRESLRTRACADL